jgi:hypothetical protein
VPQPAAALSSASAVIFKFFVENSKLYSDLKIDDEQINKFFAEC